MNLSLGRLGSLLLTLLAAVTSPLTAAETTGDPLARIVESYWEDFLELNPAYATFVGDNRFNDRLAIDISPNHRRASLDLESKALEEALAIDRESLPSSHRLTLDVFVRGRQDKIEDLGFPSHLLPVDHLQSLPVLLPVLGGGVSIQPFETTDDYDNWLARVKTWPRWVDQAIENMEKGLATGVVQAKPVIERAIPILESQIVDDPRASSFFAPIERFPPQVSAEDRERLERDYGTVIQSQIVPGYWRLARFLKQKYLPRAREAAGYSRLPGGDHWYAYLVRSHTTTDLSPREIHALGTREVGRITAEIRRIDRRPWSIPPSAQASPTAGLLDAYRALRSQVEPHLPNLFATLPKADFEIAPVEPFRRASAPDASYLAAATDGSRPGRFYVNADEKTTGVASEALFLHEAVPGHHFQVSLQRENQGLPAFRRYGHVTAYVEGWALYVESLGEQLGLYRRREQKMRALGSELFRARRLVVDTGIHALGWSREQAVEYLGSAREVDRYIAWPGQALAYKIGELEIIRLRELAQKRIGREFDIRRFHSVVLEEGAMPLDLLARRVEAWVEAEATALSN